MNTKRNIKMRISIDNEPMLKVNVDKPNQLKPILWGFLKKLK